MLLVALGGAAARPDFRSLQGDQPKAVVEPQVSKAEGRPDRLALDSTVNGVNLVQGPSLFVLVTSSAKS